MMKTPRHLNPRRRIKQAILVLIMLMIAAVAIFPFYSMLMMGTYQTKELYQGLKLVPGTYVMQNLERVLRTPIFTFYRNSMVVAISSSILCVIVSAMAGYVLAKFEFRFKNFFKGFIMVTLMVPSQLGIVAFLLEMRKMHLTDTLWPLILPFAASAFGVYWIMQFTESAVPTEVVESARLDGAGEFRIFWDIVMAFIRPACVTLLLLSFLWSWNDYLYPLVIISDNALYTIPLGIKQMSGAYANDTAAQILALSVTSLPILLLFIVFNKNMVQGLASAAVKE